MAMRPGAWRRSLLATVLMAAAVVVAACSPHAQSGGNALDAERIAQIQPGVQTRAEVLEILGTPSSVAAFDKRNWYYISSKTQRLAFFKPDRVEQQVILVKFDDSGKVSEVKRYDLEQARAVQPVARATPTRGKELGLVESLYTMLLQGPMGALGAAAEEENEGFVK